MQQIPFMNYWKCNYAALSSNSVHEIALLRMVIFQKPQGGNVSEQS